ncbi:ADP-ribosylglycohydrolase family protein [Cellulophaga sp. Asnod2-G02]|uniref:ADP-ribosylglycohydrolase family protein n=1 Tax=Cellulophaga sp. Asnod2-G02 TaxID=3160572 RepID=UPI00386E292E
MILEAAIGDAYGAGFEFKEAEFILKNNNLKAYYQHGLYNDIYKKYTDDTQMAIAIAELLLEQSDWTPEYVSDKFVEVFHRDKRRGYSERIYNALNNSKTGADLMNAMDYQSTGNGSAMRAYPIGLVSNIDKLLELSKIQAITTHNTKEGVISAQRIALTVHYYLYKDGDQPLIDFLDEILKEKGNYKIVGPVSVHGFSTTNVVIPLVDNAFSLKNTLKDSVDLGGDTDTVAELCMAILSVKKKKENNLAQFLFDELENGKYGRDYLISLDDQLFQKFKLEKR